LGRQFYEKRKETFFSGIDFNKNPYISMLLDAFKVLIYKGFLFQKTLILLGFSAK
jgi:hypothetical protein